MVLPLRRGEGAGGIFGELNPACALGPCLLGDMPTGTRAWHAMVDALLSLRVFWGTAAGARCSAPSVATYNASVGARAGSGAAPGSAWLHSFVIWPTIPFVPFGVIHAWLLRF